MVYEWDEALETGNEQIDDQHKQLFAMLNDLILAHEEKKGDAALEKALHFLTAYVVLHFQDEEDLQKQYNYPEYELHRAIHEDFKLSVKRLMDELTIEGYTNALMEKAIRVISDWLVRHIKGDDFKLAKYVRMIDNQKSQL